MKTILHISDMHFDLVNLEIVSALSKWIPELKPDLLAVSGDLTQRARAKQFKHARSFLDQFNMPKIIVPGNHDVPLYDVFRRVLNPFGRFRKIIEPNPWPTYEDNELFVFGVSTPKIWHAVEGKIGHRQLDFIRERMRSIQDEKMIVMVCHHPVFHMESKNEIGLNKMNTLDSKIDAALSGHLHMSESKIFPVQLGSMLLIQAGTATSNRHRGELNSFNQIVIDGETIQVNIFVWKDEIKNFELLGFKKFRHEFENWKEIL